MSPIVLLLASSLTLSQETGERPATVILRMPAAARLFIDDLPFSQKGGQRILVTPPLEPGYVYYYVVRMELIQDGQLIRDSKKIPLRAGVTTTVDLGEPSAPQVKRNPDELPGRLKSSAQFQLSREEQELLDLVNKERAQASLPALRPDQKLFQAAREHATNMARQGKLDHTLDEKGPLERIRATGYKGFNWGENIAYGMPTPAQAMRVWMDSEGHRGNILNEDYNEIGLGIVATERGVRYYTQVFGRGPGR